MKGLLVLGFFGILICGMSVSAQTNTVTNSDLEKFRERRLKAERDYRENYERLGMPSPEEIEKQREEDISRTVELGDRLRRERLERELRSIELATLAARNSERGVMFQPIIVSEQGGYFYGSTYFRGGQRWHVWQRSGQPASWRAAGGMVYWEPGGRPSSIWSSPFQPKLSRLQGPRRR